MMTQLTAAGGGSGGGGTAVAAGASASASAAPEQRGGAGSEEGEGAVGVQQHMLVELPNCGHAVHLEAPLQLLGVLQRFLDETASTSASSSEI